MLTSRELWNRQELEFRRKIANEYGRGFLTKEQFDLLINHTVAITETLSKVDFKTRVRKLKETVIK